MLRLDHIQAALAATPPGGQGDHRFGQSGFSVDMSRKPVAAGVLVPLVDRGDAGLSVILTKRSAALRQHAGQVSFPGGRQDPDDPDIIATALREAQEEIGLGASQVDVLGQLGSYRTGTGYEITPTVGVVPGDFCAVPEPGEVEEVFEVGLDIVLNPANHKLESAHWKGKRREFYVLPHDRHQIWGATAGILVGFSALVERAVGDIWS